MKFKALIIAQSFLFKNSTGGQVERAFFENLNKDIFDFTIICSDSEELIKSNLNDLVIVKEKKILKFLAAGVRRLLIPDLVNLPDYIWFSWGKKAVKTVFKNLDLNSYDYIHSISFPCSNHKAAFYLKEKTGKPWIAQFYDPWYDNPYRKFKTKYLKKMDLQMERKIAESADIILHNNNVIADIWVKRYGEHIGKKIKVLPLSFDSEKVGRNVVEVKNESSLIISHIGNFMLNRTSEVFINAVNILVNDNKIFRDKIKIYYIGLVTDLEKDLINKLGLNDIFNLVGTLPEEDCDKYYSMSDIFLAIDGINDINIFFPSKIMKYFYFKKPIIGITPENSVLDFELKKSRHYSFRNNDIHSICDFLYKALTNYNSLLYFDQDYWKRFSILNVSGLYEKLISNLQEEETEK